jgi:hypothetical protein
MANTLLIVTGFRDGGRGPLESGKDKKMESPLKTPEKSSCQPTLYLLFIYLF